LYHSFVVVSTKEQRTKSTFWSITEYDCIVWAVFRFLKEKKAGKKLPQIVAIEISEEKQTPGLFILECFYEAGLVSLNIHKLNSSSFEQLLTELTKKT
jgi:hypothetical protein